MELFEAIIHGLTIALVIITFMQDNQLRKHYNQIEKLTRDNETLQRVLRGNHDKEGK